MVTRVSDELYRIARALETSSDLRLTLGDPRLPVERKHGVVADLVGSRVLPLTLNLVNFVVAAGHSRDLPRDRAEAHWRRGRPPSATG